MAIWQNRQQTTTQGHITIHEKRTVYKGVIGESFPVRREIGKTIPPEDVTFDMKHHIIFHGGNYKASHKHRVWSHISSTWTDEDEIIVHIDGKHTELHPETPDDVPYDQARVTNEKDSQVMTRSAYLPIMFSVRPMDVYNIYRASGDFTRKEDAVIDSRPCLCLSMVEWKCLLYLDRERDYMPVRIVVGFGDGEKVTHVRYSKHRSGLWIAESWVFSTPFEDNRFFDTSACILEDLDLSSPVSTGEIELNLRPGTRVYDETSGALIESVVTEKGEKGVAVPASHKPTYMGMVRLNEERDKKSQRGWRIPLFIAIGCLLVGSLAYWRWRRRRHQPAAPA